MGKKESKLTNSEENDASSVEHVDTYKGPITGSKAKRMESALLLKAKILMSNYFNDQHIHQRIDYSYVNIFFIQESDLKL